MSDLDPIFRPRSVAVIGASRRPGAVGRRILTALLASDFQGPVFPINPNADHVGPHPCYPSIAAVGHQVDLAVVAVPAANVADVVAEALDHGVGGLIVVSAGFAEAGEEQRQQELARLVADHDVRMIGPNCLGVINTDAEVRLNASFAPDPPQSGGVALCSQSGALGIAVIDSLRRKGVGLRSLVSIGNAADVGVKDLLVEWGDDPNVNAILLYLESFDDPHGLAEAARSIDGRKPIVAVKAGRTDAGSSAAASHTAAVAGSDSAVDALLHEADILRVRTLDEMLDIAQFYQGQSVPCGNRVGIVTNSGGPGILTADAAVAAGMEVVELSTALQRELAENLPDAAATTNPVDMVASARSEQYREVISRIATSGEVDVLVVIYTEIEVADLQELGSAVADGAGDGDGSVAVMAMVIGNDRAPAWFGEGEGRIPVYATPDAAVATLAAIMRGRERADRAESDRQHRSPALPDIDVDACRDLIAAHCRDDGGDGWLGGVGSRRLLETAGIAMADFRVAHDEEQAAEAARAIDQELAVCVMSPDVVHKTENGGVRLGVTGPDACMHAFREIRQRMQDDGHRFDGVIVSPMLSGVEVLIGARREPKFGALLAFGLGGVLVELLGDVSFRLAPLDAGSARRMVREIRGYQLLTGYRGKPPSDIDSLVDTLRRTANLVVRLPEIAELDMNPVFAGPEGTVVADVRVRIEAIEHGDR